jgi:hypothetical protein
MLVCTRLCSNGPLAGLAQPTIASGINAIAARRRDRRIIAYPLAISLVARSGSFNVLQSAVRFASLGRQ